MKQIAHTPTPWRTRDNCGTYPIEAQHPSGKWCEIANPFSGWDETGKYHRNATVNAAFIVRACNSHAELVEALEDIINLIESNNSQDALKRNAARHKKSLAKAKGG